METVKDSLNDKVLYEHRNYWRKSLGIDKKYVDIVHRGMFDVVYGTNASAKKARTEKGMILAGKTGTAQVPYLEKNSEGVYKRDANGKAIRKIQKNCWFACFGPYEKPKYAAVILVEAGISGGTSAAPIARQFFDQWSKTKAKD